MSRTAAGTSVVSVCLLLCGGGAVGRAQTSAEVLVGVTWSDSTLVSLEPSSGAILKRHLQLDPARSYIALAWDRNHGWLHVLSQGDHTLTTLDARTLQAANVVPLRIDPRVPHPFGTPANAGVSDVTSLAYDPMSDTLFAAIGHWADYPVGPISSELATVDPWTGDVTVIGRIDGSWIAGMAFSETERVLYALGVHGAGPWDSPDTTQVMRLDPVTAAADTLYVTPWHTMLGMALKEPQAFFSWINGESHVFGRTDIPALSLTPLGSAEESGAVGAMIVRTFDLPPEPVPPLSSPIGFLIRGRVTEVSDPFGVLAGRVHEGQSFRGQVTYDTGVPFQTVLPNQGSPYGLSLQSGKLGWFAPGYAARIQNDRLDPRDAGPTDEFRLRGTAPSGVVISWTLVDPGGNAIDAGDRLPDNFDLSRWPVNTFSVTRYDPCCLEPVYRFAGRVDDARPRPGLAVRPLPRPRGRQGN
jgi:hypothetical protein